MQTFRLHHIHGSQVTAVPFEVSREEPFILEKMHHGPLRSIDYSLWKCLFMRDARFNMQHLGSFHIYHPLFNHFALLAYTENILLECIYEKCFDNV